MISEWWPTWSRKSNKSPTFIGLDRITYNAYKTHASEYESRITVSSSTNVESSPKLANQMTPFMAMWQGRSCGVRFNWTKLEPFKQGAWARIKPKGSPFLHAVETSVYCEGVIGPCISIVEKCVHQLASHWLMLQSSSRRHCNDFLSTSRWWRPRKRLQASLLWSKRSRVCCLILHFITQ